MYEIYQINSDLYQVHSNEYGFKAMEGTLLAITTYLTSYHDFKPEELEAAFLSMLNENKNAAHFGYNKYFIYAFNKADKYGKAS